jgi:3',5'-cyclic AMP phosphodiesterase CpdA
MQPLDSDHHQFLVLADIHAGQLAQSARLQCTGSSADSGDGLRSIARDIRGTLSKAELKPTLLFIPGDLTSRGSPYEFLQTRRFIEFVALELDIAPECVIVTYGNHDVDWDVCRLGVAGHAGRRDAYRELAAGIGGWITPGGRPVEKGPVAGSGVFRFGNLEVFVLNSGIRCYPLDEEKAPFTEYHHGSIGENQLAWLRSLRPASVPDEITRIALIHHHLVNVGYPSYVPDISLLEEGAEVRAELGRIGTDIVVHGHRHHPHLYTAEESGWAKPTAFICAGSFGVDAVHRANGNIPNTFHVVSLEERTPKHNRSGVLHTFRQIANEQWEPTGHAEPNVGVDPRQWFGATTGTLVVDQLIEGIVAPLVPQAVQKGSVDLPSYDRLPLDLRCHRGQVTNAGFAAAASRHGCRVTGRYPEECALHPKRKQ